MMPDPRARVERGELLLGSGVSVARWHARWSSSSTRALPTCGRRAGFRPVVQSDHWDAPQGQSVVGSQSDPGGYEVSGCLVLEAGRRGCRPSTTALSSMVLPHLRQISAIDGRLVPPRSTAVGCRMVERNTKPSARV